MVFVVHEDLVCGGVEQRGLHEQLALLVAILFLVRLLTRKNVHRFRIFINSTSGKLLQRGG